LDRLVGLKNPAGNRAGDVDATRELAECRNHLIALASAINLIDDPDELETTPTAEIARLASLKIIQLQ
jgi:hypothetical protein